MGGKPVFVLRLGKLERHLLRDILETFRYEVLIERIEIMIFFFRCSHYPIANATAFVYNDKVHWFAEMEDDYENQLQKTLGVISRTRNEQVCFKKRTWTFGRNIHEAEQRRGSVPLYPAEDMRILELRYR